MNNINLAGNVLIPSNEAAIHVSKIGTTKKKNSRSGIKIGISSTSPCDQPADIALNDKQADTQPAALRSSTCHLRAQLALLRFGLGQFANQQRCIH